jgi:hypothetical protein
MSMSTRDYQPSRSEVASGVHSPQSLLLSPPPQASNWANYDTQTLTSSLPSVHSPPPLSASLVPPYLPEGRGRSLSEAASMRHGPYKNFRGQLHNRHSSLAVPSQGMRSASFATTTAHADTEAPHRRPAVGNWGPINPPPPNIGVPHLPTSSRHNPSTQAPYYDPGRAMSPMPVAHPSGPASRQLQAGTVSWPGQRPDAHNRPSSQSSESANLPLYHRQETLVQAGSLHYSPHYSSHTSSPRLYERPVGRAHHTSAGISPHLQGHHPVSTAGTTRRLHPSRSSSSLEGTQSSEDTATEDKSAGRYECEYCSKRFNRPSSLKV